MIEDRGKALPLVIANLKQSFGSQTAGHKSSMDEKIRPRLENDSPVEGFRRKNQILGPAGGCNERNNYA